ncbi:hypothetical protein Y032_0282g1279 [Ancylostoma ceylanicum]|uniref:Immunoglobulin I-set domain protein n=1 Tax=Ancylostoma ceylanicum TaxID=53326 RepID=A0A016S7N7_9BILA|nr:hypothetical protein Y032_0282g1279 [Ancylostoma ceylanicum]
MRERSTSSARLRGLSRCDENGYRLNDTGVYINDKQQLHIQEAKAEDAGRYSCIAENKPGRAEKDLVVSILKPPLMETRFAPKEVQQSHQLTLQCPIDDPTVEFFWTKNGIPITTSDKVQISVRRDKLYLMDAEPSDSAQYACIARNEAGEDQSVFDTIVNVAPKILGPSFRSVDVILNQTVELTCDVDGTPAPTITWLLDGKALLQTENVQFVDNGRVLVLNHVQSEEEGRYTCKAENKAGKAEADTYVQVTAPPRVFMQSEEMKVVAGRGATIRCEVFGNPPPKVEWLKNGQLFQSELLQSSTNLRYLHLREASVEDAGRYTCIAMNRAGEQRASTQLHVLVIPVIEDGERVIQVKENNTLSIDCAAGGIPPPQITWKKDGQPLDDVQGGRLTVPHATASDAGRYTCTARNEAGHVSADFAVDVFSRPRFKDIKTEVQVIDGDRARLECKVEGHPAPTVRWLRGGRPIEDMSNFILSPRGETLMILKARRADAGSYSCVAKNAAGESEAGFTVSVFTAPHTEESVDQNPHIVQGKTLTFYCPVLGNPDPKVEWRKEGLPLGDDPRFTIIDGKHLQIEQAKKEDEGRYTCHAFNEAGVLDTDYESEVIAPPKFHRTGESVYEVVEHETVTLDCAVATEPKPEVIWYRGEQPLYLAGNMALSPDAMQLTIRSVSLSDGGKYTCKASNEAGSSDIDLILKVLVPPKIDKSNIIGNPLAIVERNIYLECPVSGIPQPTVSWTKDGNPVDVSDSRIVFAQNNQTFGIEGVRASDQARYTCIASNKGGSVEQDFNLEVLTPPALESTETQAHTKREGDALSITCPIRSAVDATSAVSDVSWIKDGRPIERENNAGVKISSDGRRLQIPVTSLSDAGLYTCVAINRAGESSLDFKVEILCTHLGSQKCRDLEDRHRATYQPPPAIDASRNDVSPRVTIGRPVTLWCSVSGHPFPTITWKKDGVEVQPSDIIRILDDGQMLEILDTKREHAGTWMCTAENDAGARELEIQLDVWIPPVVRVSSEAPIKAIGETVTLFCEASGNPPPSLSWTKGGQPIINSVEGVRISLKGTRLDIPHMERSDVGDYTCNAHNEAGSAEATIHVDVLVPPVIARNNIDMSPRLPTGQTLMLICDATGKPQPELKWYVNDTEITSSTEDIELGNTGKYIKITNITLQDKGVYTCIASNVAGNDTVLYSVDVVQAPIIFNGGAQQVIEGELARIECLAEGHPAPIISWLRNGIRVETGVQGVRYIAEGKVLNVIEARSSDSGIYVCAATNEAGTAQQAYTLEVLVSPKIVSTSPPKTSVPLGSPFSLKCGVRGYPEPKISWTVDGQPLADGRDGVSIAEDGTLTVSAASGRTSTYRCTVKNDAGTDEMEYEVHTISAPVVSSEGVRTVNSTEGEPTSIPCDIVGDEPQIQWLKNDAPLLPSGNIEFNEDKNVVNILQTRLSDEGEYSCVAANSAGKATQKTQVYVGVPPRIIESAKRELVKSGELATMWCEAVGVPKPTITWMRDDQVLTNTALDDRGNTHRKSLMFNNVSVDDAGVYTCKAENWAGTASKDFDLVVITPPTIQPEKLNVTADSRKTVVLPCNATGIPEPVVSWVKAPNIQIEANEKYQLIGTSLAVRNVLPSDAGFYHCIAKSEAGQAIGNRRLLVDLPEKENITIWVDCDEENRPVKTTYMQNRGDVPDDDQTLLPWKEKVDWSLNGTNGVVYKCIPGPRTPRLAKLHVPPTFLVMPMNQSAPLGSQVELHCSAVGPPIPYIHWLKDGEVIRSKAPEGASSVLFINVTEDTVGDYTCHARNSVGVSKAVAFLEIDENAVPSTKKPTKRQVAVLTCLERDKPYTRGVTWFFQSRPLDPSLGGFHFMNNGSLVITDFDPRMTNDLKQYMCKVRGRRKPSTVFTVELKDELPSVIVEPEELAIVPGDVLQLSCQVSGSSLTTKIEWTKNDQKIIPDEIVHILANNTLLITTAEEFDTGLYKCIATSPVGSAYGQADVIVEDPSPTLSGTLETPVSNDDSENSETLEASGEIIPAQVQRAIPTDSVPDAAIQEIIPTDSVLTPEPTTQEVISTDSVPDATIPELTPTDSALVPEPTIQEIISTNSVPVLEPAIQEVISTEFVPVPSQDPVDEEAELLMSLPATSSTELSTKAPTHDLEGSGDYEYLEGDGEHLQYTLTDADSFCPPGYWLKDGLCTDDDRSETLHAPVENSVEGPTPQHRDERCSSGYRWTGTHCEDIDECAQLADQCDYHCENTPGSYNCLCPPGYELTNNYQCFDIDECDLVSCSLGQMCLNTLGSFHCIPNPCPANYSLSDNRHCIPECESCADQPIHIQQIPLYKGYHTEEGIGKVIAHDHTGNVLKDTVFAISDTEDGLKLGRTKSGPFSIRFRQGEGIVYTSSRQLQPGSIHYLRVRAHSQSSHHPDSHFMLIISTGMYPF